MKPVITLYLIVNDHDYRLLHTHGEGLAELGHSRAELHDTHVQRVPGHPPKDGGERIAMAKHAAKALTAEWARGSYDRIVLAAGPKMLGEIRHDLPKALQSHVAAEIHKDLVKIPLHEMMSHFKGTVPAV